MTVRCVLYFRISWCAFMRRLLLLKDFYPFRVSLQSPLIIIAIIVIISVTCVAVAVRRYVSLMPAVYLHFVCCVLCAWMRHMGQIDNYETNVVIFVNPRNIVEMLYRAHQHDNRNAWGMLLWPVKRCIDEHNALVVTTSEYVLLYFDPSKWWAIHEEIKIFWMNEWMLHLSTIA